MALYTQSLVAVAAIAGNLLPLCVAQDITATPTATASQPAQTHTISVGIDHKFKPEVILADVGDNIDFQFFPPNHSVVRAEYEFPCIPYEMTGRGKVGFFSGFHPVDAILDEPPSWTIQINDTDPIFVYCSAPGSCITYGMVAVINPNANTSLERQRQLAKDSAYMLQPGDPFPAEFTSTASATSSSTSATSSSTTINPPVVTSSVSPASNSHTTLSKGAIAGIAVAGAAIVALAAALFFYIGRSRTLKQEVHRGSIAVPPPAASSVYQHHSFLSPKSDMTDQSSRNSALHQSVNSHHDSYVGSGAGATGFHGQGEPKAEYYVPGDAAGFSSAGARNLALDRSEVSTPRHMSVRGSIPQRYPSLALNPHDPREMGTTS